MSANFAGASPSVVFNKRRRAAEALAGVMRNRDIDVVFAQEVPDEAWVKAWTDTGYECSWGDGPDYRVRSAIFWRKEHPIVPTALPTAEYHGSYLAAARWTPDGREPVILISVHASPKPAKPEELATWDALAPVVVPARPWKRTGAGRYAGQWFDSDLVLGTLALVAGTWNGTQEHGSMQVVAAGDFNECRAWDAIEDGNWGADYFDNVTAAGYVDVTWRDWGAEVPTCLAAERELQLDHVLATLGAAQLVEVARAAPLDRASIDRGDSSDHTPIWFSLL